MWTDVLVITMGYAYGAPQIGCNFFKEIFTFPLMEHTIHTDKEKDIIIVRAAGEWNVPDSDAITTRIVEESERTGIVNILIDHSRITIHVTNLIAYKRPLELKSQFEHITPKVVFISPKGRYNLYKFFITVAKKKGILFEVFREYETGLAWLTAD